MPVTRTSINCCNTFSLLGFVVSLVTVEALLSRVSKILIVGLGNLIPEYDLIKSKCKSSM